MSTSAVHLTPTVPVKGLMSVSKTVNYIGAPNGQNCSQMQAVSSYEAIPFLEDRLSSLKCGRF